jgi:hypothetical protein
VSDAEAIEVVFFPNEDQAQNSLWSWLVGGAVLRFIIDSQSRGGEPG